ncbi:MAG: hypothetical protein ACI39R_06215 [Lachnospiraceae bacterium]
MVKFKRFLAVLLSSALIFSMTACGKDDDDDKSKDAGTNTESSDDKDGSDKDDLSAADIYEAIEKGFALNKGTYDCEIIVESDVNDAQGDLTLGMSGDVNGADSSVSMNFDMDINGIALKMDFSDLLVSADGMAYINADSLVKALSGVETEAGYYGFPLPDAADVDAGKIQAISVEMIKALFTNVEAEKDGDTYTLTLETAEDYEKGVTAFVNYVNDNQDEIEEALLDSMNSVDSKEYLKDLVEYVSDDLISMMELLGSPITQDDIDEIVDSIDEMEIDDAQVEIFEDLEDVVEEINGMTSEDWEKAFENVEMKVSLSATLDKDGFDFELLLDMSKADETVSASCTYNFKIDDSLSVEAPKNVKTLTEMVQYVMDNPELMQEVMTAVTELVGELNGSTGGSVIEYPDDEDDEKLEGPLNFILENGDTVIIDHDEDILKIHNAELMWLYAGYVTTDGTNSCVNINFYDYYTAEELYNNTINDPYEGDEVLETGTMVINGKDAYYLLVSTQYDTYEAGYYIALSDEYALEIRMVLYDDCEFSVDEVFNALSFEF